MGDLFDKDIQRIMSIINGVEKQFNPKKITNEFYWTRSYLGILNNNTTFIYFEAQ